MTERSAESQRDDEQLDLVDEQDRVVGMVLRSDAHGDPALIHRVAHVLVFNSAGDLYLQKRSSRKDVQPGKWDTSVGGHVDLGETYHAAALRETAEELGVTGAELTFMHKYLHRNAYESEYVSTFKLVWDGPIVFDSNEIEEGRFWRLSEIEASRTGGCFTPNFLNEFDTYGVSTGANISSTRDLN
ncbi:MAG TPA: NUDIX domain-containing protein [Spirochaetia bacterium]|nr:NUDIX domain-containing protein [Spirochaetia bacterium]